MQQTQQPSISQLPFHQTMHPPPMTIFINWDSVHLSVSLWNVFWLGAQKIHLDINSLVASYVIHSQG